jgi:hypothetical protein
LLQPGAFRLIACNSMHGGRSLSATAGLGAWTGNTGVLTRSAAVPALAARSIAPAVC